jgi:hypothetical protein
MRQFATLVFVLVCALAGRSQVQNFSNQQISYNSVAGANQNLSSQNALNIIIGKLIAH